MSALIQVNESGIYPVAAIKQQLAAINDLMKSVMREGVHYGAIPGCGDKFALLKPGAEKICMMFRLIVSQIDIVKNELAEGHREYEVSVTLTSPAGDVLGKGIGSASTMEKKYRYRSESTNRKVPAEYWKSKDQELLGGPSYFSRKSNNEWLIYQQVENADPADYYNTVLKMAKKRALHDAVITTTACSDIFAPEGGGGDGEGDFDPETGEVIPRSTGPAKPKPRPNHAGTQAKKLTEGQLRVLNARRESSGMTEKELCDLLGVKALADLAPHRLNEAIVAARSAAPAANNTNRAAAELAEKELEKMVDETLKEHATDGTTV